MSEPTAYARDRLVVFDCDGVLVDTERLSIAVESRVLTEMGWPMSPTEVVAQWMGRTAQAQLDEVVERLGAARAARFDERVQEELANSFDRELTVVDGVPELVERLHARGVATCVASSGTHERIRLTLGLTGLLEAFEGRIYSASDVSVGKPAPDLFLLAAAGEGFEPSACVVVEDSVPGVQAAVRAGMRVFGFTGGFSPPGALAEAGAEPFETMAELGDLLDPGPS